MRHLNDIGAPCQTRAANSLVLPYSETASDLESIAKLAALRASLASGTYLKKSPSSPSTGSFAINGTYRVFPWSVNDPSEGDRETVYAPHHPVSSEAGWHSIPPAHGRSEDLTSGDRDWVNQPGWSSRTTAGMNLTDTRFAMPVHCLVAKPDAPLLAVETTSSPRRTGKAIRAGRTTADRTGPRT